MKFFSLSLALLLTACGASPSTLARGEEVEADAGTDALFSKLSHSIFLSSTYRFQDGNGKVISDTGEGGVLFTDSKISCEELQALASSGTVVAMQDTNLLYVQTRAASYIGPGTQPIYGSKDESGKLTSDSAAAYFFRCSHGSQEFSEGVQSGSVSGTFTVASVAEDRKQVKGSLDAIFAEQKSAKMSFTAPVCELNLKDLGAAVLYCPPQN